MNRQIGVDFGTTTSVLAYRDFEKQDEGNENLIKFDGRDYVPTMVLQEGSITNKKGMEIRHEECFGWDAAKATSFHSLLKRDFKMGLISNNAAVRDEAKVLTEKFFRYMYERYTAGAITQKGTQFEKISTVVTYPGKFPEEVQQILKKAAEDAGFPNVTLVDESKAAMKFALSYDTEVTKVFFRERQGRKLKVMIIDMGAGTTDISVFEYDTVDPSNFVHLCSWPEKGGNNFGGSEIDGILCDFYKEKLGDNIVRILGTGNAELGEKLLRNKIKEFKEQTISDVLGRNEDVMDLPGDLVPIKYSMPEEPDTDLDRAAFEELLKDYLPQFPDLVHGALNTAWLNGNQVDLVLLTGAHSQWYFVNEMLVKAGISGNAILSFPEPHLVVARGAAWYVEPEKMAIPASDSVLSTVLEGIVRGVTSSATEKPVPKTEENVFPLEYDPRSLIRPVIASGKNFVLAVNKSGTVLATGDLTYISDVFTWRNIVSVAVGDDHAVGLRSDGTVVATGLKMFGACKTNDWRNIISIAAGSDFTIGLRADGRVLCTGMYQRRAKKNVPTWPPIDSIAVPRRSYDVFGLRKNGELYKCSFMFKALDEHQIISNAKIIRSLGENDHIVALTHSGTVVSVDNYYKQDWKDIVAIDGCDFLVGLKTDGTVVSTEGSFPWNRIIAISVGKYRVVGIRYDGYVVTNYDPHRVIEYWKLF